jgi:hypothetical protein
MPDPGSGGNARRFALTASIRAARCQPLAGSLAAGTGAVSARNRSSPAAIAAASSGVAVLGGSILGRGGRRLPFLLTPRL